MILNKWRHVWLGVILIVVLVAGASVVAGCGGDEAEGKVLKINVNTEPPSLDPNLATDTTSALVINNIFEGLVHIDPSGEPYPGVAESWDVSDDGLVYTFNLRGDDTWTNGDTVTSQDFKNSWLRTLNPETGAAYAYMLYFIDGAAAYNSGEGAAEDVGIETPDETTLVVTLGDPAPWFVPVLSHQSFFPINKATVDEFGDKWTEPENIVTNGAFTLEAWNHDSDLLLKKWGDWREADSVMLGTIEMPIITEATTGVASFESGEIDIQMDMPTSDMSRLKELPEYENFPMLGVYYYGFNVEHPPLDDVRVRKALALAIDRQAIIDNVAQADQLPATGVTPKGMPVLTSWSRTTWVPPRKWTRPRHCLPRRDIRTVKAYRRLSSTITPARATRPLLPLSSRNGLRSGSMPPSRTWSGSSTSIMSRTTMRSWFIAWAGWQTLQMPITSWTCSVVAEVTTTLAGATIPMIKALQMLCRPRAVKAVG